MGILEGEEVTKHFGGLAAVHDVNFEINQGEVVGLIGPNGAGKTTLFNLITGSLRTTAGEIRFKGKKISGLKPHQICRLGIARTFQTVQLFGNISVLDNVFLGSICGTTTPMSTPDARKKAMTYLELVELSAKKSDLAKNLPLAEQNEGRSLAHRTRRAKRASRGSGHEGDWERAWRGTQCRKRNGGTLWASFCSANVYHR